MSKSGAKLSDIVSEIPKYYMVKDKISLSREAFDKNIIQLKEFFSGYSYTDIDGLKFDLEDSWIHIRPSNTEPVVRVIAEAKDIGKANKLVEETKALMKQLC